ncbi:nicotinamide riboside transporter PnuC [Phaeacidiphilus oryzae]|uniref:nicotinamide riboside transporter PnuC n=1 Tax=Phaeacidiphilus oryzae TaxID=348818 RepID=UPI000569915F|nr:nicotinamide riboside transporter PnuC [Phaeacidiphilus oryzae]
MPLAHWLDSLVAPLNAVLFHFGQDAVTWAELLGFATGALCVGLTVGSSIWNFPVGIANNLFFLVLFWQGRLYADASLQIVYLALGAAGWWEWLHGGERGGERRGRRTVRRAPARLVAGLLLAAAPATWGLTVLLASAHDIAPFWDALTTALSLAAQWLLNLKKLQNWYFWIAADVVYVPLYFAKVLYLTGIVYVVFLAMCLLGLRAWRRELAAGPAGPGAPAGAVAASGTAGAA